MQSFIEQQKKFFDLQSIHFLQLPPYFDNRCTMPKATDTYNIEILHPEIAAECHPFKNGTLTAKELTPGSGRKIWWQCRKAHEWQATVHSRTKGSGCPQCHRETILKGKPIVSQGLLVEWHPSLNRGLNPRSLSSTYALKLWWLCRNGHEWEATLRSRLNGRGCPECAQDTTGAGTEEEARTDGAYHQKTASGFSLFDVEADYASESYADTDFRSEKRYPYQAAVMTENDRHGNIIYAFLRNVSPSGFYIETDYPIRGGEKVIIRLKEKITASSPTRYTCRVKWCKQLSDDQGISIGYSIGLQIIK